MLIVELRRHFVAILLGNYGVGMLVPRQSLEAPCAKLNAIYIYIIFFEHAMWSLFIAFHCIYLWCLFLDPHPTTHHANMQVFDLRPSNHIRYVYLNSKVGRPPKPDLLKVQHTNVQDVKRTKDSMSSRQLGTTLHSSSRALYKITSVEKTETVQDHFTLDLGGTRHQRNPNGWKLYTYHYSNP